MTHMPLTGDGDPGAFSIDPDPPARAAGSLVSENEFSCHCCYDVLVDPTTLNCGHSFCRHCLAQWWESSRKNECPECRDKWEGFPKVNILLRDAVLKFFPGDVRRRREEIQLNPKITRSLQAFRKYGEEQASRGARLSGPRVQGGGFFSGVLTALTCVAVMLLVYHWSSREAEQDLLVHKPVTKWTAEEVTLWLEQLGPWASLYKDRFLQEHVNGRLLMMLGDEEFSHQPYSMENHSHRKAVLAELERVKALGVKPPQNLWEYKAVNAGKSLFLLYAMKSSPRLTLLYLYLFDYANTFLPFMHTCCLGGKADPEEEDVLTKSLVCKCSGGIQEGGGTGPQAQAKPPSRGLALTLSTPPLSAAGGAQLEAVDRVPGEVLPVALPADRRVRLGLAGGALLDIPLRHRQRHAAVAAGGLRAVAAVGPLRAQDSSSAHVEPLLEGVDAGRGRGDRLARDPPVRLQLPVLLGPVLQPHHQHRPGGAAGAAAGHPHALAPAAPLGVSLRPSPLPLRVV
ncbi:bifunctional apoptosis regulator isoform X1 [Amia ocellicauda]|uniref:bifunctional apoptosis regulator isoform X1 n=1 Tax=Amia ocellicauda TaxID=2972642 RepID=UPI003463D9A4